MANPFDETDPSDKLIHKDIESTTVIPSYISRFRIERMLGEGTFGSVFLAIDEQLQRTVAIKVAKPKYVVRSEDRELYLAEARNVASLEHSNIVPVYDVGSTDEFPIYIVSRFIEGRTLAETVRRKRMEFHESALLVAKIAEALHYAHLKKLVHRDIKPGNILIDSTNEPFLVDFGLALREEDTGNSHRFAGTPSYMSPEQARGEGHRVDGRSDLFSLGVTFYELLVGKRPFISDKKIELLDLIVKHDPRPPRQCDDTIPKELERICLKALSKRPSERHTTGHDLAEDLRHFLESGSKPIFSQHTKVLGPTPTTGKSSSDAPIEVSPAANSDSLPLIKPKGLRSFEKQDAEFFLDLLPGQRDRAGIPSSIGFWKERIEERDEIETFSVGLVYGPSGCGKSSLMKAGLLPRLSESIVSIYLEATPDQTERTLNTLIRKRLRAIPLDCGESLVDLLTTIRRKQPLGEGKKLLLVIDQFEQWLFAHPMIQGEELLLALSQCDGVHLQTIVMVREDFWMGATRFFRELDIDLDRRNSAAVDLFDKAHAKKVLVSFGKAYGRLPEGKREENEEQSSFLNEAIDGLIENGKIISVRLSLFAEMMKDKEWTIHALHQVGGTLGIGATFLEENFSISTAPPKNRLHQAGARKILAALLPVDGTDIKGHMRSSEELLAVSGYENRSKDFQELIKILDTDLRLITPVERSELTGSSSGIEEATDASDPSDRFYQLTHDYLVPSLRGWLTRKQGETRKGRAELKLAERSSAWNLKRESKQLPSLGEWISITRWTSSKDWSDNQTKMMRKANQHYGTRTFLLTMMALLISVTGWFIKNQFDVAQANKVAREKVRTLLTVETSEVPDVLKELQEYRSYADPLLKDALQSKSDIETLHAKMALVEKDSSFSKSIIDQILIADPRSIPALCSVLKLHCSLVLPKLQEAMKTGNDPQFLRAGAAMVELGLASNDRSFSKEGMQRIAGLVVRENPILFNAWAERFSGIGSSLGEHLASIAVDPRTTYDESQVRLAIDLMNQESYRQAASQRLLSVVSEKNTSLWDELPLNPEWKTVPQSLVEEFQREDAAIEEWFAFHPALSWKDLPAVCQTLKDSGYRPDHVRPFRMGEKLMVSIIWQRDGRDYRISMDMTAETVESTDVAMKSQHYHPLDIAAYLPESEAKEEKYCGVWIFDLEKKPETSKIYFRQKVAPKFEDFSDHQRIQALQISDEIFLTGVCEKGNREKPISSWGPFVPTLDDSFPVLRDVTTIEVRQSRDLNEALRKKLDQQLEAIRQSPENPDLLLQTGQTFFAMGKDTEALDCYDRSLKIQQTPSQHLYRALVLARMGKTEESQVAMKAFQTGNKDTSQNSYAIAVIAAYLNKPKIVDRELEALMKASKGNAGSLYNAACAYAIAAAHYEAHDQQLFAKYKNAGLNALKEAIVAGYENYSYIDEDSDLDILRDDSSFQDLLPAKSTLTYLGISQGLNAYEVELLRDVGVQEHKTRAQELIGEGYRIHRIGSTVHTKQDGKNETLVVSQWIQPKADLAKSDASAERKARAGLALWKLGSLDQVAAMWNHSSDPTMRSYLMDLSKPVGVSIQAIEDRLFELQLQAPKSQEKWTVKDAIFDANTSQRRGLIQSLGDFSAEDVGKEVDLKNRLLEIYRTDSDAGIHGVCRWTLSRWGLEKEVFSIDQEMKNKRDDSKRWEVNSLGMTMVKNRGPVQAWIEDLKQRPEIDHNFAIGMTEITIKQYAEFEKANREHAHPTSADSFITDQGTSPRTGVSWFDTAAFCNWLSEREGIPKDEWCYVPNSEGKYAEGMGIAPNAISRIGYRLPTEAEWEYSCRAETKTPFCFGNSERELERYGWYTKNSDGKLQSVSRLRPNSLGLFDMHGNALEWGIGCYSESDPKEDVLINANDYRLLRGGSFTNQAAPARSSFRDELLAEVRLSILGFRLARTYR